MLLKLFILTFVIVAASLDLGFELVWKKPAESCERDNYNWAKFFPAMLIA